MKKLFMGFAVIALAAFGVTMFMSTGHDVEAQESTNVNFVIDTGNSTLTIWATGTFNFDTISVPTTTIVQEKQFTWDAYFRVEDFKWLNTGYYTTLQITDLTGLNTNALLLGENVKIRTFDTATILITGTVNADVVVPGAIAGNYVDFYTAPITFINRGPNVNEGKLGKYAVWPRLQLTVPAFQAADTYQGVVTYTLYDRDLL